MVSEIVIVAIVGVVALALLKNVDSINTLWVRVGVIVIMLLSILPQIKELMQLLRSLDFADEVSRESLKILIKVTVILTAGSIGADICRDNGENAIASCVELATKITAISLSIPVITAVIGVATGFLS